MQKKYSILGVRTSVLPVTSGSDKPFYSLYECMSVRSRRRTRKRAPRVARRKRPQRTARRKTYRRGHARRTSRRRQTRRRKSRRWHGGMWDAPSAPEEQEHSWKDYDEYSDPEEDEYSDPEEEYWEYVRQMQAKKAAAKGAVKPGKRDSVYTTSQLHVGPKLDWGAIDRQEDADAADKAATAAARAATAEAVKKGRQKGKRRVRLDEGQYVRGVDLEDMLGASSAPPPT